MPVLHVAVAFVSGLLVGAAMRPLVFTRSVPRGQPLRNACPACGTVLLPSAAGSLQLVRGRCAACRERIPPAPGVAELLTAVVFAGLAVSGMTGWTAAAHYWLAACGTALVMIDVAVHRLPDVLTLPASAGTLALLTSAALAGEHGSLPRALAAAAALGSVYLLMVAGGMGMGDVKLAPAVGALLGWHSWSAVILGTFAGFALAAVFSIALLATRRATRKDHVAFGPFLLGGALLVSALLSS
ncbi:A24 family peptidase [Streptomyces sp. NPDC006251]|uniref:prepilin peptidase n=1 Tax=Streptomyces sp. NPDC006251 TaxID=3155718 RepID=UPI0033BB8A39